MCETRIFSGDINALEIDERIESVDAAQAFGRVVAMCDEMRNLVVDGIVEGDELLGAQV